MGRTLPSITNAFLHEQQSLTRFRRALRRTDQRALDDLFAASRHHLAAAAYASHLLPFEIMLLSMLVEEHKQVLHLQLELERLHLLLGLDRASHPGGDRASPSTGRQGRIPGGDPEGDPVAFPHAPADAPDSGMEDREDTLALLPGRRVLHEAAPSAYLPLAEHREEEEAQSKQGAVGGDPAAFHGGLNGGPPGDRASHPEGDPAGDRASHRASHPVGDPVGDPGGEPPLRKRKWWAGG